MGLNTPADVVEDLMGDWVLQRLAQFGGDDAYYHDCDATKFRIPAFDKKIKCTCCCCDALNSGVTVGLANGFDPETIVCFAQATSALDATGPGHKRV